MIKASQKTFSLCFIFPVKLLPFLALILLLSSTVLASPGALDMSFGIEGKAFGYFGGADYPIPNEIAIQSDGKIVVAGSHYDTRIGLARFNAAGTIDKIFGKKSYVNTEFSLPRFFMESVVVQPDGKIVVGGGMLEAGGYHFILVRYHPDGTRDTDFGNIGIVVTRFEKGSNVKQIFIQPDGKIIAAGQSGNKIALARYNTNGTLDTSFGENGKVVGLRDASRSLVIESAALQGDGKIVVAASSRIVMENHYWDFELTRFNSDGSIDNSFGTNGRVITSLGDGSDFAKSVVIYPNGKILVGGYADVNGNYDFALARYHTDGTLDMTFNSTGIVTTDVMLNSGEDEGTSVALQPDGKIILAGGSSGQLSAVVRYNSNGSVDPTFGTNGRAITNLGYAHSVAIQPDGKIVLGILNYHYPVNRFALVRYLGDEAPSHSTDFDSDRKTETGISHSSNCVLQPIACHK